MRSFRPENGAVAGTGSILAASAAVIDAAPTPSPVLVGTSSSNRFLYLSIGVADTNTQPCLVKQRGLRSSQIPDCYRKIPVY
jgi:hypothetical protein